MAFSLDIISQLLIKVAGFIVIFVISFVVGRVTGKLVERLLHELGLNKMARGMIGKRDLEAIIGLSIRHVLYITGLVIALRYLGLGAAIYQFIMTIIIILIAMFLLLQLFDIIPNLIAWMNMKIIDNGKQIEVDGIKGRIIARGLTGYILKTDDNDRLKLPYSTAKKLYK